MKTQGAIGPKNEVRKAAQKSLALTMVSPVLSCRGTATQVESSSLMKSKKAHPADHSVVLLIRLSGGSFSLRSILFLVP